MLFATTDAFRPNTDNAVHAFCHAVPATWHQMGVTLSATDSLSWLAEIVGQSPAELGARVPDQIDGPSDVLFLPYLSGERTPHNAPDAAGAFHKLRRTDDLTSLVHAVFDGVAFSLADCRDALSSAGAELDTVYLAGGGTQSRVWLTCLAAATGFTLLRPKDGTVGAALGAARLAMAAATGAAHSAICHVPEVLEAIAPDPVLIEPYQEKLVEFRRAFDP